MMAWQGSLLFQRPFGMHGWQLAVLKFCGFSLGIRGAGGRRGLCWLRLGVLLCVVSGCGPRVIPAVEGGDAPQLKVVKLDGEPLTIDTATSPQPLIVQFWAMACCGDQLPETTKLHQRWAEKGLRIIAVNSGNTDAEVLELLRESPLPYEVVMDPIFLSVSKFGVSGIPTTFFIRKGSIVWKHYGILSAEGMEKRIEQAGGL